ncbi:hypothetical protein BBJ28_00008320 [Nothophytophthora sp. Chile5]|nr:hypothetical protein BBJ28_00008320 [Nothophytophthora sp. Chile5]
MKLARHELIHDDNTRSSYSDALKQKLPSPNFDDGNPINTRWDVTFAKIQEAAMQTVGFSSPSQRRKGKYNDPVLVKLSEQQRQLRLRIYNDKATITTDLRSRRNRLLHQIRDRCCELANNVLDDKISRIESTSGSHQMFTAVRDISYRKPQQLLLRDEASKYILHRQTASNIVRDHFKGQFLSLGRTPIVSDTTIKALLFPITSDEFRRALHRLNNGRAAGPDDVPAELLKYPADELAPRLDTLLNRSFERGEPIGLGDGILLCLQKPRGECSSLRPIVLLNTIRKAVSLIVLHRITPAVDKFLSPHQIWIRPHRIIDKTRIRLYNCYVLPILLYNCGTWALTPSELRQLESFHRRQLRSVLNVRYPRRIPNAELYEACEERPLRHRIVKARWGLLGHILRRPWDIPAFIQMKKYFAPSSSGKWRGRPRTTLPGVLDKDFIASGCGHRLRSDTDLEALRLAQDKRTWKALMTTIADTLPSKGDSTYADTTLCRRLAKLRLAQV